MKLTFPKFMPLLFLILYQSCKQAPSFSVKKVIKSHLQNDQVLRNNYTFEKRFFTYNLDHDTLSSQNVKSELILEKVDLTTCTTEAFLFSDFLIGFPESLPTINYTETYLGLDTIMGNKTVHVLDLKYSCASETIIHRIYSSYIHNRILAHHIKIHGIYFWIDPITRGKQIDRLWDLRRKIYLSDENGKLEYLYADQIISEIN